MLCYMQSISGSVSCCRYSYMYIKKLDFFFGSCAIYTSGSCSGSVMILKLIEADQMCMRAFQQLCIREILDLVGIVGNNVLPFLLYFCC